MKDKLEKINKNTYLVFGLTVFKIYDILKPLFVIDKPIGYIRTYYANYDWLGFSIQIVTIVLLYVILNAYTKLKNETNIFNFVGRVRLKRAIRESRVGFGGYSNISSVEVEEAFQASLKEEYNEVKELLIKIMPDKSTNEIVKLLSNIYPKEIDK